MAVKVSYEPVSFEPKPITYGDLKQGWTFEWGPKNAYRGSGRVMKTNSGYVYLENTPRHPRMQAGLHMRVSSPVLSADVVNVRDGNDNPVISEIRPQDVPDGRYLTEDGHEYWVRDGDLIAFDGRNGDMFPIVYKDSRRIFADEIRSFRYRRVVTEV